MERRDFIMQSAAAGMVLGLSSLLACGTSDKKLNILVLGGTYFAGPAIVNAALQAGHSVTLFNRGLTNPDLFPQLALIKGDREAGPEAYEALQHTQWDDVIDVWPEKSRLVNEATTALSDHAAHYVFISSIAVYRDFQQVGLHEESEVVELVSNEETWYYPEEKLAAENAVKRSFPNHHTILRAGPIKGWRDPALDLLYWCIKLNRDEAIIAPGSGMYPLQFVDVKDVGKFAVMAAEQRLSGVYNCTGSATETLQWKTFLETARDHFGSHTKLVWAAEDFLAQNQVYSFSDLPLWAPISEDKGFMQISNHKLSQTAFAFTPIQATLDDCMNWFASQQRDEIRFGTAEVEIGLERSRELALIEALQPQPDTTG